MNKVPDELQERIAAYIDGQLSAAEAARLEVFLANTDPALAQQVIEMIANRASLRLAPRPMAPRDLSARVMEQIERATLLHDVEHLSTPHRGWWRSRGLIAAGLVLVLGGFTYFMVSTVIMPSNEKWRENIAQVTPTAAPGIRSGGAVVMDDRLKGAEESKAVGAKAELGGTQVAANLLQDTRGLTLDKDATLAGVAPAAPLNMKGDGGSPSTAPAAIAMGPAGALEQLRAETGLDQRTQREEQADRLAVRDAAANEQVERDAEGAAQQARQVAAADSVMPGGGFGGGGGRGGAGGRRLGATAGSGIASGLTTDPAQRPAVTAAPAAAPAEPAAVPVILAAALREAGDQPVIISFVARDSTESQRLQESLRGYALANTRDGARLNDFNRGNYYNVDPNYRQNQVGNRATGGMLPGDNNLLNNGGNITNGGNFNGGQQQASNLWMNNGAAQNLNMNDDLLAAQRMAQTAAGERQTQNAAPAGVPANSDSAAMRILLKREQIDALVGQFPVALIARGNYEHQFKKVAGEPAMPLADPKNRDELVQRARRQDNSVNFDMANRQFFDATGAQNAANTVQNGAVAGAAAAPVSTASKATEAQTFTMPTTPAPAAQMQANVAQGQFNAAGGWIECLVTITPAAEPATTRPAQ